jgi:hypothetical protein
MPYKNTAKPTSGVGKCVTMTLIVKVSRAISSRFNIRISTGSGRSAGAFHSAWAPLGAISRSALPFAMRSSDPKMCVCSGI